MLFNWNVINKLKFIIDVLICVFNISNIICNEIIKLINYKINIGWEF